MKCRICGSTDVKLISEDFDLIILGFDNKSRLHVEQCNNCGEEVFTKESEKLLNALGKLKRELEK